MNLMNFQLKAIKSLLECMEDDSVREIVLKSPTGSGKTIMLTQWPTADEALNNPEAEVQMNEIMDIIRAVRNLRADMNVKNSKKLDMIIFDGTGKSIERLENGRIYIERFANTESLKITDSKEGIPTNAKTIPVGTLTLYIPIEDLVDFSAELERLNAEKMTAVAELERAQNKLSNESFVSKAPAALVEKEKEKVHKYSETIASIEQQINAVKNLM